jgi:tetratricopeptide (TPR) repeat protein
MPGRKPRPGQRQQAPMALAFDRRVMEQQMQAITRLLEGHDFASLDEANAFLQQQLATGQPLVAPPATPLEEAQELVYQALETTGPRRLRFAREALARSPDCADAYVLLAEASGDPQEARALYEQGVRAGERALGPAPFREDVGHFWGILETRPYMRARHGLAAVLWHLGEREAAIGHVQDLLRLNPGDNQGVRYTLATWLLATGDDAALGDLLGQYPEEGSATWAFTRALAAFRRHGAGGPADAALREALATNPFVPAYLLGLKPLPRRLPAYVGVGAEDEAVAYIAEAAEPWLTSPEALVWLATVVAGDAPSPVPARPRRRRRT